MIESLSERMTPLEVDEAPLEVPRGETRGAHWLKPELVAEIAFTEFTTDGILRHPSFIALREDKPAREVVREKPVHLPKSEKKSERATAESFGVKISNPDRVIYPGDNLTKGDLADYYAAIEALMMVDTARRPISLIRCPQGRAKHCFFQKHDSGTMGEAVKHVPIKEKDGEVQDYLYVEDAKGLLACVQMGTIEFHGWGSRIKPLEKPDRLVFDLDPDVGLDFAAVRSAAVKLRALLSDLGLKSFPAAHRRQGHPCRRAARSLGRRGRRSRISPSASRAPRPRPSPSASPPISARTSARAASSSTGCATSAARPR